MKALSVSLLLGLGFWTASVAGLEISTPQFTRVLTEQNDTLVTREIKDTSGPATLTLESQEFGVRLQDGTLLTALDYRCQAFSHEGNEHQIRYTRRANQSYPADAPLEVIVHFTQQNQTQTGISSLKKTLTLIMLGATSLASLEVERFTTKVSATRGGRGEPVVLNQHWILLPENPTLLTRHTDGNQPLAYSHHFEKVGNHSLIDFENGDLEPKPTSGLVRCFHFPPTAHQVKSQWVIESQAVVLLATTAHQNPETCVIDFVRPSPRTFTHYNNWFDSSGKDIRGDRLSNLHQEFQKAMGQGQVKIDAMVPDNGWQNRQSVWQPAANFFPQGMSDLAKLGQKLQSEKTSLGLWLALDGTTNDVGWGVKNGYTKAKANSYFSRYFGHYSLADKKYNDELTQQVKRLVDEAQVSYFKFDFNHLSNVVPTDRHGHEAEMAGYIRATQYPREHGVFINATNWTWHSPSWLNYASSVWLLAGDDGFNANWPELAGRAQATTDRDVFFWRMWGQPEDRPWFPISSIMTHGIIRNKGGQMSFRTDSLRDWSDYVLMHYGRGTLLREWYLTPSAVLPEEWKALLAVHQWTDTRRASLDHTCYVGGRPDEGEVYGYMGWTRDGKNGTLVARNPAPQPQKLIIPLNATTQFLGQAQQPWKAHQVYPQLQDFSLTLNAEQSFEITIPGYETIALEIAPGMASPLPEPITHVNVSPENPKSMADAFEILPAVNGRRELVVIGRPELPNLKINGQILTPSRQSRGKINQFPGYARDGMPSKKANAWAMAGYDLSQLTTSQFKLELSGGENSTLVEAWVITENNVATTTRANELSPLTFTGVNRQTTRVMPLTNWTPVPAPKISFNTALLSEIQTADLSIEVFGINAGYGEKTLYLNQQKIAVLPTGGDQWKAFHVNLNAEQIKALKLQNDIEVQAPVNEDKFKVGKISLKLTLKDGRMSTVKSPEIFTSHSDWAYFEGKVFQLNSEKNLRVSPALKLEL